MIEPRFRWQFPGRLDLDPSFLEEGRSRGVSTRLLGLLHRRGVETSPVGLAYWDDTRMTAGAGVSGRFTNVLTGATSVDDGTLPVSDALADFPVALLTRAA